MPYFDDVVLTIKAESDAAADAPDFSCDATGANLNPDTTITTRNYLCGSQVSVADAVWTLTLDFDQNWSAGDDVAQPPVPAGLSQYLFDHAGEKATVLIQSSTLAKQAQCTATLIPTNFGGTAGEIAESSIDLGVDGQPVFTDYTPTTAMAAEPELAEADA
jgi:hypothetical protein